MSAPIISVENLSKRYFVGHRTERGGHHSYIALRDVLGREIRNAARKALDVVRGRQNLPGDMVEEFWALKDISFDLHEGEVLGVIGRNGAGKSTLLKILSRITEPTSGRVILRGRVASLLEVGTGFHPELSGRENIYLNGAILGMGRAEIRRKLDEIVAFAEVERFLDTPVKRYSSGMYVRLAFAVAAHLEPEILIVDEVLAVGDLEFQKKCLGKMNEVSRREGRTVLFVSHNMTAVRALCERGIVLDSGKVVADGPIAQVVQAYTRGKNPNSDYWSRSKDEYSHKAGFQKLTMSYIDKLPVSISCSIEIAVKSNCLASLLAVDITDALGTSIMQALPSATPFIPGQRGHYAISLQILLPPLIPGTYWLTFWMGPHYTETYELVRNALSFDVLHSPTLGRTFPHTADHGYIVPESSFSVTEVARAVEDAS